MYIFVCEDSLPGIFTGVYDAWACGAAHDEKRLVTKDTWNLELFAEYVEVNPDGEKAVKVMRTVYQRLGEDVYQRLCFAALSDGADKADVVYHTIVKAFSLKRGELIFQDMHEPAVMRSFALSRSVYREASHLYGFLRFRELGNGLLLARCSPKHRLTTILADHFSDRLPMEHFIILNDSYHEAAVHEAGKDYFLCDSNVLDEAYMMDVSGTEDMFQHLWKEYFTSMTIEARKNPKLQMQMFPKKYWKDSVELGN